jgi:uncharacterized protein (TIGR02147 family)
MWTNNQHHSTGNSPARRESPGTMTDIFAYLDYRALLTDLLTRKHAAKTALSSRAVALKTGIDPSYFSKVLKGSRNITHEQTIKIAEVVGFDTLQTEYFELLVRFNQANGHDAKRIYFEKMIKKNPAPAVARLTKEQYRFYNRWYHTVIRDLLHFYPHPRDYRAIAKMLLPAISPKQARDGVALLEKLGIIRPLSDGGYSLANEFITAGPEVKAFAIKNFQIAMMDMAKRALERLPKEKREISALTLSLSEQGFDEVKHAILEFKQKMFEIAQRDENISGVYQINFQAFPVSRVYKRADEDVS